MIKNILKYWNKSKKDENLEKSDEKNKTEKVSREANLLEIKHRTIEEALQEMELKCIQRVAPQLKDSNGTVFTQDSLFPNPFSLQRANVSVSLIDWYATQNFIGYQLCAIFSQHWLIDKACTVPARDAVRKGFDITKNDGEQLDPEIFDEIRLLDLKYKLTENLVEFVRFGRIYGIRLALFHVKSDDPNYYQNPFNIDGVTAGSYVGMSQIDPYWITPDLDSAALADPGGIHFYEPTYWIVSGVRIHRSHFAISVPNPVPDVLKPTYFYGGVSIPQKIYERVYNSERTANEAPLLAMTKRTGIYKVDITQAIAKQGLVQSKVAQWEYLRNNFGMHLIGLDEEYQQFDTSLSELDAAIMTQYQLVAAGCNVPVCKLFGTSPKGFNTTGEYEEANYHEELESIQTHDLTSFVQRHHQLIIKSEICPKYNIPFFETEIIWNKLDTMTEREQAEVNKIKAEGYVALQATGAINGENILDNLIKDPTSGFSGIEYKDQEEIDLETEQESQFAENITEKIVV